MTPPILVAVRLHAGGNTKNRPSWFSKQLCMRSILHSVDAARANGAVVHNVVFYDQTAGPAVGELADIIEAFDEVVYYEAGSSRKSWQRHLRLLIGLASFESLPPEGLIYLVEDDHLHHEDAIESLTSLEADYGLLYSLSKTRPTDAATPYTWVETLRGVSSFCAKKSALIRDKRPLIWMSNAGPAFDLLTWAVLRGVTRFSTSEVFSPLRPTPPFEKTSFAKASYQIAWRMIANVWSSTRPRRAIMATSPSLATHAELGWLAPDMDWESVARGVLNNEP